MTMSTDQPLLLEAQCGANPWRGSSAFAPLGGANGLLRGGALFAVPWSSNVMH
jgi:hypothetical protein